MMLYIGKGEFIPDVPARDLTAEEVRQFGGTWLLSTGLYINAQKSSRKEADNT